MGNRVMIKLGTLFEFDSMATAHFKISSRQLGPEVAFHEVKPLEAMGFVKKDVIAKPGNSPSNAPNGHAHQSTRQSEVSPWAKS